MVLEVWQTEEALFHERCGTYRWEWEDGNPYEWGFTRCEPCAEIDSGIDALREEHAAARSNQNIDRDGWSIGLFPKGLNDGD